MSYEWVTPLRRGVAMTNSEYQQLVEFLGRQFAGIDQHFAEIDQHFAGIDQRFVGFDRRFDTLERGVAARFDAIEAQLRDILGHFDQLYLSLDRLEQECQAILQGLRRIEARLGTEQSDERSWSGASTS